MTRPNRAQFHPSEAHRDRWNRHIQELHSDGSQTHNYSAFGRVIALQQLPAGAGPGVVSYLLAVQAFASAKRRVSTMPQSI